MRSNHHHTDLNLTLIGQLNHGILVMKHFFELNRKLLPLYYELNTVEDQSEEHQQSIMKINLVFDTYKFDVSTSKSLLNSDILDYIQHAYFTIQNNQCTNEEKREALDRFLDEYEFLKKNWDRIQAN
ncbi:MAG: hypothetical protein EP338_02530 [Bacteroidetes bacterium]|nr:MAG: hypothetical protein EP338_02530 [Bacteroidota bacterium]